MCVNSLFLLYYIIIIIIIAGGEGTFDHKSGSFRQLASKNYGVWFICHHSFISLTIH